MTAQKWAVFRMPLFAAYSRFKAIAEKNDGESESVPKVAYKWHIRGLYTVLRVCYTSCCQRRALPVIPGDALLYFLDNVEVCGMMWSCAFAWISCGYVAVQMKCVWVVLVPLLVELAERGCRK